MKNNICGAITKTETTDFRIFKGDGSKHNWEELIIFPHESEKKMLINMMIIRATIKEKRIKNEEKKEKIKVRDKYQKILVKVIKL